MPYNFTYSVTLSFFEHSILLEFFPPREIEKVSQFFDYKTITTSKQFDCDLIVMEALPIVSSWSGQKAFFRNGKKRKVYTIKEKAGQKYL